MFRHELRVVANRRRSVMQRRPSAMDGIVEFVAVQLKLPTVFRMVIGKAVDFDGDFVVLEHQISVVRADLYVIADCEMRFEGACDCALWDAIRADDRPVERALDLLR